MAGYQRTNISRSVPSKTLVRGSGSAERLDDGSLEIAFAYDLGDEAVLKASRAISSAAC